MENTLIMVYALIALKIVKHVTVLLFVEYAVMDILAMRFDMMRIIKSIMHHVTKNVQKDAHHVILVTIITQNAVHVRMDTLKKEMDVLNVMI